MKNIIIDLLEKELKGKVDREEIENLIERPPSPELGDFAFPCYILAKIEKKSPLAISETLAEKLRKELPKEISGVDFKSAYVNFFIDKKWMAEKILKDAEENFGKGKKGRKIVMDYSHPNVAKHFGIHNLRSTLIGHALYNVLKYNGDDIKSVNHLGDWGTQYGKLIVAYKKWGKNVDRIEDLSKIYVKFHDEAEKNSELDEEARAEFKKLEDGDEENLKLWKMFYDISMKEFNEVYDILGIEFDEIKGESFFKDKFDSVEEKLRKKDLLKKSEGAEVVEIEGDKPPLIFKKSDEASTYASRDLAAIFERIKNKPEKILYVVDVAQSLHFEQVFEVAEKLGVDKEVLEHVKFGRMKFKGMKMSTRKGQTILFGELLKKAEEKILRIIEEKNPKLKDKKKVARKVALSAIIFNDLKQDRVHDVVFDWGQALSFEGRTGPYILYTYARASSILRKTKSKKKVEIFDLKDEEIKLLRMINDFQDILKRVGKDFAPHFLAEYVYELAKSFNEFYHASPVLGSKEEGFRLALIKAFRNVMKKGLNLLGIEEVEEM